MVNIPVNSIGTLTTGSATGSFAGFTVVSGSATITGLKDSQGNNLTSVAPWIIPAGTTVPIYVISCSLSSGAIVLYP